MADPRAPSLIPEALKSLLSDRYRIESVLGRGGMATVYIADDLKHGRKVAIKLMNPEIAAAIGSDRFLREIEIAARLSHPHILPLFDSGAVERQLYYVMPYVAGESLRARLDRERQLTVEEALRLTREISSALGHAHHRGLVHRDVKPENVLLSDGIALVADFGIARVQPDAVEPVASPPAVSSTTMDDTLLMDGPTLAVTPGAEAETSDTDETVAMEPARPATTSWTSASRTAATRVGTILGTPRYMAPEQAAGSPNLDARADLYAMACMLYEMLTGRPPFSGRSMRELLVHHARDPVPPLALHRPGLPEGLERVVVKALAKSPADRYESMAQFVEALGLAVSAGTVQTLARAEPVSVPNNLPHLRTRFIGREADLEECTKLLGETRLLTLIGIGGSGKTRLALKVAERLRESYADGTWFVDLSPLADGHRVPKTVADAMGIHEEPGRPMLETLAERIVSMRTLLVLDNCEHLLAASAELVDTLLNAGGELRVIATSRETLGVTGERPFGVRSLALPPARDAASLDSIAASDAVLLFVDRAQVVAPDFTLTPETAPAVAEICRRLDGIPLAIEFAAARVEVLSVEQIRAKLDDRFRLLTGGSKALPRHQTLHAVIQWSFDHLTESEQQLFRRLSVFAGGCTLAGATAVSGEGADEFDVLEVLTHLAHKSLVVVKREGGGVPRYGMLETVRQFGLERLNETGAGEELRSRHLDYYLAFAEQVGPLLVGPKQAESLRQLDLELDNLLAAHAWCDRVESGAEKGLRLVGGIAVYWSDRGLIELGLRVYREALTRPGGEDQTRASVLAAAGSLAFRNGLYAEARTHAEESLALANRLGDRTRAAWALHLLGAVAHTSGDLVAAREWYESGLSLARETGDRRVTSDLYNAIGMIRHSQGELADAAEYYRKSLALKRELGNVRDVGILLLNLAQLHIQRGELGGVRAMILESFEHVTTTGSKLVMRSLLDTVAGLASARAEWTRAARWFGAADAALAWSGAPRDPGDETVMVPMIARTREQLGESVYAAAYAAGGVLSYEQASAEMRTWLESPTVA